MGYVTDDEGEVHFAEFLHLDQFEFHDDGIEIVGQSFGVVVCDNWHEYS